MSRYPDGMASSYRTTIESTCNFCDYHWEADAIYDLGATHFWHDGDAYCPECGKHCDAEPETSAEDRAYKMQALQTALRLINEAFPPKQGSN